MTLPRTFSVSIVFLFHFCFVFATSEDESFNRELRYCCPMSSDKVTLLIDGLFCVGIYNERRALNINCDIDSDTFGIIEYSTLNVTKSKKFCFITEEYEEFQVIAICMKKAQSEWHLDLPYYFECLSIIYLCLTLFGYSRIESLHRPEDIPFLIFTGILTASTITDVARFILIKRSSLFRALSYIQFYTNVGSFIWMNIIMLYQIRENM